MVKYTHTQTFNQQQPMNCLNVFDHFVGLALEGLISLERMHQYLQFFTQKYSSAWRYAPGKGSI